ncbi:hypothetical protein ACQKPE_21990 [Pseudomonas sp. NPDC089554]|uniref:hypothetical protein n=1 Tax=Pseudomonas sp. NPDC089554 TaxID=3390653 RepID=UPI003CFF78F6
MELTNYNTTAYPARRARIEIRDGDQEPCIITRADVYEERFPGSNASKLFLFGLQRCVEDNSEDYPGFHLEAVLENFTDPSDAKCSHIMGHWVMEGYYAKYQATHSGWVRDVTLEVVERGVDEDGEAYLDFAGEANITRENGTKVQVLFSARADVRVY